MGEYVAWLDGARGRQPMSVRSDAGHNEHVTEKPPDRFLSDDGRAGWFAYGPEESRIASNDDPWQPPPRGSVIRLMGEDSVVIPLWSDEDGLLFADPEELVNELGVSSRLAADLAAWGIGWQDRAGQADHDAEAARLVRRLRRELEHLGYGFVYWP